MVPTPASSRSRVQSVSRACELLRVLETGERSYTALALARETGLDRTVVYRLLRTLADEGRLVRARAGRGHAVAGLHRDALP